MACGAGAVHLWHGRQPQPLPSGRVIRLDGCEDVACDEASHRIELHYGHEVMAMRLWW